MKQSRLVLGLFYYSEGLDGFMKKVIDAVCVQFFLRCCRLAIKSFNKVRFFKPFYFPFNNHPSQIPVIPHSATASII